MRATVVVPVRNAADLIGIELEALATQSVSDFEVIISDNGSTDGTREVALAWRDRLPHLRIVDSSQQAGVSHARNVGALAAATDKVMFCDADDIACPTWVEDIARGLDTYDIVGGVLDTVRLNPESIRSLVGEFNVVELPTALRYLPYAYGGNMGVRTTVLKELGGFDTSYRGGHEEVDFCWRAQEAGYSIGLAPRAVLHYRLKDEARGMMRQRYWFGRSSAQLQGRFRRAGMPPFTVRRQVRVLGSTLLELPQALTERRLNQWAVGASWAIGRLVGRLLYGRGEPGHTQPSGTTESFTSTALHRARQAKHQGLVVRKRVVRATRPVWQRVLDASHRALAVASPLRFDATNYPDHPYLAASVATSPPAGVPRVIYALWTGANPLTPNRQAGLATLQATAGIPVVLVTPETLVDHLVPGYPLHPAYEHLSLVHRSDYLRCYLMHHHGGGYADIKRYTHDWSAAFDQLDRDPEALAVGYHEEHASDVGHVGGRLEADLQRYHRLLIGNGAFVMRPRSALTTLWWDEVNRLLDRVAEQLAAHPGDVRGTNEGYPLEWTQVLGDILHPLELRFASQLRHDDRLRPSYRDYK